MLWLYRHVWDLLALGLIVAAAVVTSFLFLLAAAGA